MKIAKIQTIFEKLSNTIKNPKVELDYVNNYTLLVAVVLSAQSTDKGVNLATKSLFEHIKTPKDMVEFGEDSLRESIKTIGLFKNKAKNIISLSHILIDKFNGEVPNTLEDLISLPGVGRKTANVILNTAFNKVAIAVDTHVFRVSKRIGLSFGKTTVEVENDLLKIIPEKFKVNASNFLVLHGRYICKARKPMCESCAITKECNYFNSII